jgi:hypothetical protein
MENTRKCCGIPPQVVSRLEEATGRFPPARNHCTAMQRSGRGARSGTDGHYSDAPKRSFHGGFSEILEIPWEFQQKEQDKKKIRGLEPFQGEKPGKTAILGVQNRPKMHPFEAHLGSKRWQLEPRSRVRLRLVRQLSAIGGAVPRWPEGNSTSTNFPAAHPPVRPGGFPFTGPLLCR